MSESLIGERTRLACWRWLPRHRQLFEGVTDFPIWQVQSISAAAPKRARGGGARAPQTRSCGIQRELTILFQFKFNGF